MSRPMGTDREYVHALVRGLNVIRAFDGSHPTMTPSEVADRADIHRAAARRFLMTLVREGYAETDGKYFRLRPKILELGFSALSSMTFSDIAGPVLEDLSATLDETCLAAVLEGEWVVYVASVSAQRVISIHVAIGSRLPAFCMSTGRVLLAALPDPALDQWLDELRLVRYTDLTITSKSELRAEILEAREKGWAIVNEEYELGVGSLSVPIRGAEGATVAALNVCCPTQRVSVRTMQSRFLPAALEAAELISALLPEDSTRRPRDLPRVKR
jgi:IclR family pca regulon transcriptional regulator